jgi:hypothetical protein
MSASANVANILKGFGAAKERALAAAKLGMDRFGEQVIGDSQQLCPIDTGALKASGTTLPAEVKNGTIEKVIGHNTNYAAAVHERKSGKAASLEGAINRGKERQANRRTKLRGLLKDRRKAGKTTGASHLKEEKYRNQIKSESKRLGKLKGKEKRARQGQSKFLETAVRNNAPKMAEYIGSEVKKAL